MFSRFRLSETFAASLVGQFGTPLYVVDESAFRARIAGMLQATNAAHSRSRVSYASKANGTLALLRVAHEQGCSIDVASEGELRAAIAAGVPPGKCHLHGSNKLPSELALAVELGIGEIVIDHCDELIALSELRQSGIPLPRIVLRLNPAVSPETHRHISTGQRDSKFGLGVLDGGGEQALRLASKLSLSVFGVHAHVGSQLSNPESIAISAGELANFCVTHRGLFLEQCQLLNVGGGGGARYLESDPEFSFASLTEAVEAGIRPILAAAGLDPIVGYEPGRSLIAECGVTLYTVGKIKQVAAANNESRTYVSVDGGMSDNPRPALYNAQYQVERVCQRAQPWTYLTDGPGAAWGSPLGVQVVTVSGRHCESDTLFPDVELPADLAPGDVLQVLTTGAYNASMASNYNRFMRPPTVLIDAHGGAKLVVRRETIEDVLCREI